MNLLLQNIHKAFGNHIVFQDLSFDFSNCGFYLLCGKSGSGKSTLLNIIAGYESIDSGERTIDKDIHITSIFQTYELIEELTVYENLKMLEDIYSEDVSMSTIIQQLSLQEIQNHYPYELSAGQQQRVGIARALMQKPQVIICDEPTESLDIENKKIVLDLLKKHSQTCIVIVASHEKQLMENYCDYCYEIKNKKLSCTFQKQTKQLLTHFQKRSIDHKQVKIYFHKIFHKRTLFMTYLLMFMIFIQVIIFQIDHSLFMKEPGTNALNYHYLYINQYATLEDNHDYRMLLDFQPIEINHQLKKVHVYPSPHNDLKNNEVIINQNIANALDFKQSSTLELTYQIDDQTYPITFVVKDIIEEKDVKDMQIYYSNEYIVNILKNTPYSLKYPTQYDYLYAENTMYEIYIKDDVIKTYNLWNNKSGVSVYHSILTDWSLIQKQQNFYHMIFVVVEIILLAMIFLYVFYDILKSMNKSQKTMSIFYSLGIPLTLLKQLYFNDKMKTLSSLLLIPIIEVFIYSFMISFEMINLLLMLGYILVIVIIYIVVLKVRLNSFQVTKISSVFKDV